MKKALIAGTVSLAVAAMPVVGVFAADTNITDNTTDTLRVEIASSCTFTSKHAGGNVGTGVGESTTAGTWVAGVDGNTAADTLSATMLNGTKIDDFGSTSFTVICNNAKGWRVTNTMGSLAGGNSGQSIEPAADYSAAKSGYAWKVSQAGDAGLKIGGADNTTTTESGPKGAGGEVARYEQATDTTGKTFKVTYGVGISQTQAADIYTGTVTYSLAILDGTN